MKAPELSQDFPHYKGAICCHGNQSSDLIWPKTYCIISPTPVMLQFKFYCDGALVAEIFMFESVDRQTDERRLDWYTISSPCEPSA